LLVFGLHRADHGNPLTFFDTFVDRNDDIRKLSAEGGMELFEALRTDQHVGAEAPGLAVRNK
jgi:hypothetical protein